MHGPFLKFTLHDPPPRKATDSDFSDRSALNRVAQRLTRIVDVIEDGGTVCLDAPWGEGKTWFVTWWLSVLNPAKYSTLYLNAYKFEHVEDPLALIADAVATAVEEQASGARRLGKSLRAKAAALAAWVAPAAVGGASAMAAAATLDVGAIGAAAAAIGVAAPLQDALRGMASEAPAAAKKLGEQAAKKAFTGKSVISAVLAKEQEFRSALEDLISVEKNSGRRVIIVIDELDRTSPAFALRLLERLKHYLETENLVFVVACHKRLIEAAVSHSYGVTDELATTYLEKFFHLSLRLPKIGFDYENEVSSIRAAVADLYTKHSAPLWPDFDAAVGLMHAFGLSLRASRRVSTEFLIARQIPFRIRMLALHLLCVKATQPALYYQARHDRSAMNSIASAAKSLGGDDRKLPNLNRWLSRAATFHSLCTDTWQGWQTALDSGGNEKTVRAELLQMFDHAAPMDVRESLYNALELSL